MVKHKEDEQTHSYLDDKHFVRSPCCPHSPLARSQYGVIFCSACGIIYEKVVREYKPTTHNVLYYTKYSEEAYNETIKKGILLIPEHLYLYCKGTLQTEIKRVHDMCDKSNIVIVKKETHHTKEDVEMLKMRAMSHFSKVEMEHLIEKVAKGEVYAEEKPKVEVKIEEPKEPRNPVYPIPEEDWEKKIPF